MDFASRIVKMSQNYKQTRLVFDRCITGSLKSRTRRKGTSGNEIRYHIADNTNPVDTRRRFNVYETSIRRRDVV